jgi:hypothetical protein
MRARLESLGVGARLAAFAIALVLLGGAAAAIGSASGLGVDTQAASEMSMEEHGPASPDENGLATAAAGYAFQPEQTAITAGATTFRFRIAGLDGRPATDFDLEGGVRLHLIVVRRDFSGYRHLHPTQQADGSWVAPLALREPGAYRAFADFEVDGKKIVLGHDLLVGGSMTPRPLPAATRVASAGGYSVALAGSVRAGTPSILRFAITRNGAPVERFEDYVGMRGHLIALREGDLAYTHLHALDEQAQGRIDFDADLPTPGRYRLFLQFKAGGRVRTVPFTLEVGR